MARTTEDILREQLGNLMLQVAILSSERERLAEENNILKGRVEALSAQKNLKDDILNPSPLPVPERTQNDDVPF